MSDPIGHVEFERRLDIPYSVRMAVLERDLYQCQLCGTGGENRLQLHHVVYRSHGGSHERENLITLCFRCHMKVHDGLLAFDVVAGPNDELHVFPRRLKR